MRRSTTLLVLAFFTVTLTGCIDGPDRTTPPQDFWEPTPPATLDVVGTLQTADPRGDSIRFRFEADVVDCETTDGPVTVDADATDFFAFQDDVPTLDSVQSWERRASNLFPVHSLGSLDVGQRYLIILEEQALEGSTQETPMVVDLLARHDEGGGNLTLEATLPDYPAEGAVELYIGDTPDRRRFIQALRPWTPTDLQSGLDVHASFVEDDGEWSLTGMAMAESPWDPYIKECPLSHARDLRVTQYQGGMAFSAGVPAPVSVSIRNADDGPLPYRPGAAFMVDLTVVRPDVPECPDGQDHVWNPGPDGGSAQKAECLHDGPQDRLAKARVEACTVQPPPSSVLDPGTETEITYTVTCDHDVPETHAEDLALVGQVTFTDEFDVDHEAPSGWLPLLATFLEPQTAQETAP